MHDPLDILSNYRPVEVPDQLQARIRNELVRVQRRRRRWLQVAAAAAALVWGVQTSVLLTTPAPDAQLVDSSIDEMYADLFGLADNTLYDEQ